tara:strand:- start:8379 stop:8957 length:579 start_codon:yes stop_codon:yes gene_type:complete
MIKHSLLTLVIACAAVAPSPVLAESHVEPVNEYFQSEVFPWLSDPVLIDAVREQNARYADLTPADIEKLDLEWRAQVTLMSKPLVDAVLERGVSKFLAEKQEDSKGMITEIFLMDAKGLNVGQSEVTSDYWQGDEAKWQRTFGAGTGEVFVDRVETDESTQALQSQASVVISDPETGEPIGAITIGINLDKL